MQLGAHFAGIAIEQSMLGAAHACANPLTARFDLPHGLALAILLPHVVRWNAAIAGDRYGALLGSPSGAARDADAAEVLAVRLEASAAAGMPGKLSDAGVTATASPSSPNWPDSSGRGRSTRGPSMHPEPSRSTKRAFDRGRGSVRLQANHSVSG